MPPMAAGLFGYMSYDMVRLMEKLPDANPDMLGVPDGLFLRPTVIAVFDTIEDLVTVVTPVRPRPGLSAAAAYAAAQRRSEEHTSELQSLMRISYAVFCLKKKTYETQYSLLYSSSESITVNNTINKKINLRKK